MSRTYTAVISKIPVPENAPALLDVRGKPTYARVDTPNLHPSLHAL